MKLLRIFLVLTANVLMYFLSASSCMATQQSQTITFPNPGNKTYGVKQVALNARASSGLTVTYSVISGPATVAGNVLTLSVVGVITVEADQPGNAQYAAAPPVQQTFSVNQARLTVTALNASSIYGAALPTFIYSLGGFVNGDNKSVVSGAPGFSTTAQQGSPVGAYPITISNGTLSAANYYFGLVNGTLTIKKATLKVLATSTTAVYGTANFTLSYTLIGFVNGDTQSVVSGMPTLSTTATQTSPVGSYPIIPAVGTLAAANYTFAVVNGRLTITQATLMAAAANASVPYDQAMPSFTYALTGFQNSDTQSSSTSGTPALSTTASQGSNAGQYPINIKQGTLASQNYKFTFAPGTLTITPLTPTGWHVVVIFQENRSTDNLFHGLPGADTADSGVNSKGETIPLTPVSLAHSYDIGHSHANFNAAYDGGKMDGADKVGAACGTSCPPNPQFKYVDPSEIEPYFTMAEQYTFADRMFQTNQGPSFPAHQMIFAGTSAPSVGSPLFASENPSGGYSGCLDPEAARVQMIDTSGKESTSMYPCFEHPTLADLLDDAKISWRYYAIGGTILSGLWNAPQVIQHICVPNADRTACTGADYANVSPPTQVLNDIANGVLPAMSWVMPSGQASDHGGFTDGSGPSWVASIVNAMGNDGYWDKTIIFITWDDWGGWYDHVAPPIINSYEYGFRVPLIVVSPFAKRGHISHVTHDFGSILNFIEKFYNLPSLGYADAIADDLSDCFDFQQTVLPFQTVPAKFDANYFLNDKTPPTDPDDD